MAMRRQLLGTAVLAKQKYTKPATDGITRVATGLNATAAHILPTRVDSSGNPALQQLLIGKQEARTAPKRSNTTDPTVGPLRDTEEGKMQIRYGSAEDISEGEEEHGCEETRNAVGKIEDGYDTLELIKCEDERKVLIEETRLPLLKDAAVAKRYTETDAGNMEKAKGKETEEGDSVVIGSGRSSAPAPATKSKPVPTIKIDKCVEDLSDLQHDTEKSPFADMIDRSLCEYLGGQSFASNSGKSGTAAEVTRV